MMQAASWRGQAFCHPQLELSQAGALARSFPVVLLIFAQCIRRSARQASATLDQHGISMRIVGRLLIVREYFWQCRGNAAKLRVCHLRSHSP